MRTQNLRGRGRTPTPKYPRPHISGDYGIIKYLMAIEQRIYKLTTVFVMREM